MKILVGLGNPGDEYVRTRHNFGFMLVDLLADDHFRTSFKNSKLSADAALLESDGQKVLLLKPQTFMNLSGEAVNKALGFYKRSPHDLLVIYDDLDLPLGRMKFGDTGSTGGHRGMESIVQSISTRDFHRLRLGIGRPAHKGQVVDYVLAPFKGDEAIIAKQVLDKAAEAVLFYLKNGIQAAANRYNGDSTLVSP